MLPSGVRRKPKFCYSSSAFEPVFLLDNGQPDVIRFSPEFSFSSSSALLSKSLSVLSDCGSIRQRLFFVMELSTLSAWSSPRCLLVKANAAFMLLSAAAISCRASQLHPVAEQSFLLELLLPQLVLCFFVKTMLE